MSESAWIRTSEQRPEDDELVIVVHQTNYQNAPPVQSVGWARYVHGQWEAHGHGVHTPTHWQRFPSPPPVIDKAT